MVFFFIIEKNVQSKLVDGWIGVSRFSSMEKEDPNCCQAKRLLPFLATCLVGHYGKSVSLWWRVATEVATVIWGLWSDPGIFESG